jgi:hypothetical protein
LTLLEVLEISLCKNNRFLPPRVAPQAAPGAKSSAAATLLPGGSPRRRCCRPLRRGGGGSPLPNGVGSGPPFSWRRSGSRSGLGRRWRLAGARMPERRLRDRARVVLWAAGDGAADPGPARPDLVGRRAVGSRRWSGRCVGARAMGMDGRRRMLCGVVRRWVRSRVGSAAAGGSLGWIWPVTVSGRLVEWCWRVGASWSAGCQWKLDYMQCGFSARDGWSGGHGCRPCRTLVRPTIGAGGCESFE